MDAQIQLKALLVLQDEVILDRQVLRVVRVDDGKLAALENCSCDSPSQ